MNSSSLLGATTLALALAGCASFSPDGGFGPVEKLTRERIGASPTRVETAAQSRQARERVTELLAQPLTPDTAVEVALLQNPGLQASYAELGIAEADRVRAGRLDNPSLRFGRLSGGGTVEIDRGVLFDVLGLLTLPWRSEAEGARFTQVQMQAADDTLAAATEARLAFFEAVAAQESANYAGQVEEAAQASSELARRMQEAGHFSALDRMREQSFLADATVGRARARHQALAARERLVRALGLEEDAPAIKLPERLPDLPAAPVDIGPAEQTAMDRRLDVQRARLSTEATARSLGLFKATRMVNVLHAGYQNQSATGEPRRQGYEIELVLPLFDFGSTRVARAESVYLQALQRTAAAAVQARSEVRETHSAYRTAYEVARHYRDEVVPLRKRVSEEQLLRYNGMLASVFDLLADARLQIAGVQGAVEALKDFWVADTRLQMAIHGRSPGADPGAGRSSAPPTAPSGAH